MRPYKEIILLMIVLIMASLQGFAQAPATPPTPNVSTNTCGNKTVSRNGTPPTKVVWYWQTSASGTSMSDNNPSITASSSGTYYLRAYNFFISVWSTGSASVYVTVNTNPTAPSTPSVQDLCHEGIITRGNPPGGVTWYWQSSSSGTSMADSNTTYTVTSSGTYYLRARNTYSDCWSSATSVNVTLTTPPSAPGNPTASSNTCGNKLLTRTGSPPHLTFWYWQTSAAGTSTANLAPELTATASGTYYLRAYNSTAGCWSQSSGSVSVTVNDYPSTPTTPSVDNQCGNSLLTRGFPPTDITWYWQGTNSSGTNMDYPGSTYSATNSNTYYLRARNDVSGCWSLSSASVVTDFKTVPAMPSTPTILSTCGSGVLQRGAHASGSTSYWQVSETGTSTADSNETTTVGSGTYYLRAQHNTSGCWSASAPISITVNPGVVAPVPVGTSREEAGIVTLSSTIGTNATGNEWHSAVTGGTLLATTQNYSPTITGTQSFWVSSVNSSTGCGSSRVQVTADVYPKPVISATATEFTMGNTITLSVSNATYQSYSWKKFGSPIASSSTLVVTQSGEYTVTVTQHGMTGTGTADPVMLNNAITAQSNLHYVTVNGISEDGVTDEADVDLLEVGPRQRAVTYLGGWGNTLQTIVSQASPSKKDLVQPVHYDEYGRQLKQYLPYASTDDDSKFRIHALDNSGYTSSEQYGFYQNTGHKIAIDTKPYSVIEPEPSPLGRMKAQTGVGEAWHNGNKKVVKEYKLNRATDNIRLWRVNTSGMPVSSAAYSDYQLHVDMVTDENGHQVKIYTDKLGRTVQKDVEVGSNDWLRTVQIYNDLGQMAYTISPKGVQALPNYTPLQTFLDQWAFQYRYDAIGRLVEYRAPGADWIYTVYDILNRPVLSQNADLRSRSEWSFIKYDVHGRAVVTGIKAIAGSNRTSVQLSVDAQTYNFELKESSATGYTLNRMYPSASEGELLSINYYDGYGFLSYTGWDAEANNFSFVQELGHTTYSERVQGLATGSKVRIIGSGWLNAVQYYDDRYRPVQVLAENHLGGLDRSTNKYNNLRQLIETKATHDGNETVTVVNKFTYDHALRITHVYQNINSASSDQLVANYEYNVLGQLVDKKLHDLGGSEFMQSVDYRYTIRGWLRSINNSQLTSDSSNDEDDDYFGMQLSYNTDAGIGNAALYNGNISAVTWKGPGKSMGTQDQQSYKFSYDRSNRLLSATSQMYSGSTWAKEAGVHNEVMSYDANGNIGTLQRNQKKHTLTGLLAAYQSETMDNLTYTYSSSQGNQLKKVEDASGKATGFDNGANISEEYTYSADGALTADENKGVEEIIYNALGKPEEITFTDGRRIEYTYSASGTKLIMKAYQGTTLQHTTDYVGSFVYEDGNLTFFGMAEGRVVKKESEYTYEYAIADHQGNTRVVFTSAAATPEVSVADFESSSNSEFDNYPGGAQRSALNLFDHTDAGTTYTYSNKLNGGYSGQVGVAKSYQVYPGDKVKIEAYAKFNNITSTGSNVAAFASALLSAYGVPAPGGGEIGTVSSALNAWGGLVAGGDGGENPGGPKAFVNILIFDKNFNFLDIAYEAIDPAAEQVGASPVVDHDYLMREYTIKETGYVFMYVSNENETQVDAYFDDVTMTYTPSNIIQYNEYYPFGLQTDNSWTRESHNNNYLYNQGNELNQTTNWYEMFFREYDPALGRMLQVDPYASLYVSKTPYGYVGNNPVLLSDPSGGSYPEMLDHWRELMSTDWTAWMPGRGFGFKGPGSGNHWSNGIGRSDWTLAYGSQSYMSERAASEGIGGYEFGRNFYTLNGASITAYNGKVGYWESYSEYDLSGFQGTSNNMVLPELTIAKNFVEFERQNNGNGWDWAAGGRALVRALVPFGNDIYPDSEEPGYDPNKKLIAATVPDLPIGPGGAKLTLRGIKLLVRQKGIWKWAVNGRVASKETLEAGGLLRPSLTATVGKPTVAKEFVETASGVQHSLGPKSIWQRIKESIAILGQLE